MYAGAVPDPQGRGGFVATLVIKRRFRMASTNLRRSATWPSPTSVWVKRRRCVAVRRAYGSRHHRARIATPCGGSRHSGLRCQPSIRYQVWPRGPCIWQVKRAEAQCLDSAGGIVSSGASSSMSTTLRRLEDFLFLFNAVPPASRAWSASRPQPSNNERCEPRPSCASSRPSSPRAACAAA